MTYTPTPTVSPTMECYIGTYGGQNGTPVLTLTPQIRPDRALCGGQRGLSLLSRSAQEEVTPVPTSFIPDYNSKP